jgi:hypothetical protein
MLSFVQEPIEISSLYPFLDEVNVLCVPEVSIETDNVHVPESDVNLILSSQVLKVLGLLPNLRFVKHFEHKDLLKLSISHQHTMSILASSQWSSQLKVLNGPIFRVEDFRSNGCMLLLSKTDDRVRKLLHFFIFLIHHHLFIHNPSSPIHHSFFIWLHLYIKCNVIVVSVLLFNLINVFPFIIIFL